MRRRLLGPALAAGAFAVMEGVSYATHRWVMHGPGMGWHRSHHAPPEGLLERNDLFPVCFSTLGVGLFAAGAVRQDPRLSWLAGGVTAYGALYLLVHEVHIHRRLPAPQLGGRYLDWLRESHADHHAAGGEPFGMLLPLQRDRSRGAGPLERGAEGRAAAG